MRDRPAPSVWLKISGILLVLLVGLFNFHVPHFLLESSTRFDAAALALALGLSVNLAGALVAAVGIGRGDHWGWLLGVLVVVVAFALYVAQETVGLPGCRSPGWSRVACSRSRSSWRSWPWPCLVWQRCGHRR